MHAPTTLLLSAVFGVLAAASPVALVKRSTTCGSTDYSTDQVNDAANAACNYVSSGTEAGSSTYPHVYNNYEGFDFPVSGPYYEFPMLTSGTYDGGSPGADRVVINGNCELAGEITHTGASGNDFVGCSGTS